MILCDKNAFVLAMDLKGSGGGGFCLSFCFSCYLSCNTEHYSKDQLCYWSGNWSLL